MDDTLETKVDVLNGRMSEVETTLFGAKRDGQGFLKDTRETLEVVRTGMDSVSAEVRDIRSQLKSMRGWKAWAKTTLPPVLTAVAAVAAVVLAK